MIRTMLLTCFHPPEVNDPAINQAQVKLTSFSSLVPTHIYPELNFFLASLFCESHLKLLHGGFLGEKWEENGVELIFNDLTSDIWLVKWGFIADSPLKLTNLGGCSPAAGSSGWWWRSRGRHLCYSTFSLHENEAQRYDICGIFPRPQTYMSHWACP